MEPLLGTVTVLGAMALGASCGLRIFVAPFVLSLLLMLGALESETISFASSPWVTLAVLVLLLLEIAADKLPGVDQVLDAAGLVLRPAWAAGIVLALEGEPALMGAVSAALLALFTSLGKARLRIELRSLCSGETAAMAVSPLLSLVEDSIVAAAVLGALLFSPVGFGLVLSTAFVWHFAAALAARWRWRKMGEIVAEPRLEPEI